VRAQAGRSRSKNRLDSESADQGLAADNHVRSYRARHNHFKKAVCAVEKLIEEPASTAHANQLAEVGCQADPEPRSKLRLGGVVLVS